MKLDRSFGYLVHDVARLFARRFNQRALLFLGLTRLAVPDARLSRPP